MTKEIKRSQRLHIIRTSWRFWVLLLALAGITLFITGTSWSLQVAGQRVPSRILAADAGAFEIPDDVIALHYYGVGGWGIKWRGQYVLLAPYFSNHGFLGFNRTNPPNINAIAKGFSGTPISLAGLILVGHGHVDHAADIPGYPAAGLPANQAGVIANLTTLNMLASLLPPNNAFRCAEAPQGDGRPIEQCTLAGFRITPLRSAHAPNVKLLGKGMTVSTGSVDTPLEKLPRRPADFRLGTTWAYLIDLLDDNGDVIFRIHYMDAAAGSDQSGIPAKVLEERAIDIHIACVPGYNYVEGYPEWAIEQGDASYVMLGHWEDFFRPRDKHLKPVTLVLNEKKLNNFITRVENTVASDRRNLSRLNQGPINKESDDCPIAEEKCGPRGKSWAMPIPGETYQFRP